MKYSVSTHLLTLLLAALLTSCGGGGGSSPEVVSGGSGSGGTGGSGGSGGSSGGGSGGSGDTGDTSAGISGSGKAIGVITQFGSIFVNGVEYDTSEAVIIVNGVVATEDDLGVGMVVFIQGTVNEDGVTGVAEVVIVDDNLKGPISAITSATDESGSVLDARQITVLGIDVVVERTGTVFEDTTFESLSQGDLVEVYGFTESGNNIRATRVELKEFIPGVTKVELYGEVTSLDTSAETFLLGDYTINFASAEFDDIDPSNFADGILVEVKGTLATADALIIDATKIEPTGIDAGEAEDNGDVEVDTTLGDDDEFRTEGTIESYDATNQTFIINGTSVDASSAALVPGNLVLEDGLIVQVEGTFSGDVLVAEKIKSRRGRIEIEAPVSALDPETLTVSLNLGVGVLDVLVTAQTLMDDDRDSGDERFNFEDLQIGDYLEVEAFDNEGTLTATRLDREDEDEDEIKLQAPVDDFVAEESITLLGLQFGIDGDTEYESIGGSEVPAEAFFAQLSAGFLVKLEDEHLLDGIADELGFEDPSRPDGGYEYDDEDDEDDEDDKDDDDD
ncbi:DUF5666 domain-containing protein [Luminiphilus sp.]|nr:DUF5666 domain-containing protein [Luminiphilus sp.]MDB2377703.1 DUF5666 domain-containing protein [Luminiphilus sp.]